MSPGIFLPLKVLGRLFRRKFISYLQRAFDDGKLICTGQASHLIKKSRCDRLLDEVNRIERMVYAKPPFGGPRQMLNTWRATLIGSPLPIGACWNSMTAG